MKRCSKCHGLMPGDAPKILLSALYLYAAQKKVPQAFDGMAQFAFAPK